MTKRNKAIYVFAGLVLFCIILPFGSACSCIPKNIGFDMEVVMMPPRPDLRNMQDFSDAHISQILKTVLDGLSVKKTSSKYSGLANWVSGYCPVPENKNVKQAVSCSIWLEKKLIIFDKGWLIKFIVKPDRLLSDVNVERIYGVNRKIVYSKEM